MSETNQLTDEQRVDLLKQHDNCLEALYLNRSERRRRGLRTTRAAIEDHLFQVGMAIARDNPNAPVYDSAAEFLADNPE